MQPLAKTTQPAIYNQGSLLTLTLSHLRIVADRDVAATMVAVASPSSSRGRSAPNSCRCRAASPISARPFRRWRCWRSPCRSSASATTPTLVALFLYGLLPIFENALTGLTTLPPAVTEAARGVGMTGRQRLLKVELPLALPVILARHPALGGDQPRHRDHRLDRRGQDAGRGDHRRAASPTISPSSCRAASIVGVARGADL